MQKTLENMIFPKGAYLKKTSDGAKIYRIDFEDGYGEMTTYSVLPGIILSFNNFHTFSGFQSEARYPGAIEINHCLRGRFECMLPSGEIAYLGAQDFAVNNMARPPQHSTFPLGEYYGISLVLEIMPANNAIAQIIGPEIIDLQQLIEKMLSDGKLLLLRADPKIQHIFSELYDLPAKARIPYFKLKIIELLLFLTFGQHCMAHPQRYVYKDTAQRTRQIAHKMTENLRIHYSVAQLAAQYQMSCKTLQRNFQKVYGQSPYAYLKHCRIETAALLLQTTDLSIHEIAQEVGYQNASKFSSAFADIYKMLPSEYRKGAILD